jgi:RNA polymerase sigma factor (sigma-70 family)
MPWLTLPTERTPGAPVTDDEARTWLPFAERAIARMRNKVPERYEPDLISAASEALVRALMSWRPNQGATLSGWVWVRMRGAMQDEARRIIGRRRTDGRPQVGSGGHVTHEVPVDHRPVPWDRDDRRRPTEPVDPAPGPEDIVLSAEREAEVARLIAEVRRALSARDWSDLVAYEIHRVSQRVLGERYGVTQSRVAQRLKATSAKGRRAVEAARTRQPERRIG